MNTRFKVFSSHNILQYLCDFIHVLIFVTVSMPKKSQINEYSVPFWIMKVFWLVIQGTFRTVIDISFLGNHI
jgi:hypothetical protein